MEKRKREYENVQMEKRDQTPEAPVPEATSVGDTEPALWESDIDESEENQENPAPKKPKKHNKTKDRKAPANRNENENIDDALRAYWNNSKPKRIAKVNEEHSTKTNENKIEDQENKTNFKVIGKLWNPQRRAQTKKDEAIVTIDKTNYTKMIKVVSWNRRGLDKANKPIN